MPSGIPRIGRFCISNLPDRLRFSRSLNWRGIPVTHPASRAEPIFAQLIDFDDAVAAWSPHTLLPKESRVLIVKPPSQISKRRGLPRTTFVSSPFQEKISQHFFKGRGRPLPQKALPQGQVVSAAGLLDIRQTEFRQPPLCETPWHHTPGSAVAGDKVTWGMHHPTKGVPERVLWTFPTPPEFARPGEIGRRKGETVARVVSQGHRRRSS